MNNNYDWSLDALYTGFDSEAFKADYERLKGVCAGLEATLETARDAEGAARVEPLVRAIETLDETVRPLMTYAMLRTQKNTADGDAVTWVGRIEALLASTAGVTAAMQKCIADTDDLESVADQSEYLSQYRYYLTSLRRQRSHMLSDGEEALAAKLNLSGASAWVRQFETLTSSVKAVMDGREYSLPEIRNFATNSDAAVRKAAYEAELKCYSAVERPVAFALCGVKKQANTMAEVRGYDSVIGMTLEKTSMQRATLDAMWSAIEAHLPVFWGYLKAKARLLGHKNGLPWYDLFAPVGSLEAEYSPEEARDYLVKVFSDFAPEMADMMQRAFDDNWIDMYPAPGKVGGAFCDSMPWIKQSRILTNYNGSFDAVDTLAHELGHAFHGQMMCDNAPLNRSTNMQLAETASTFNEMFFMDRVLQGLDKPEERLFILESILSGNTQVMCDIYSRYTFESEVVARCVDESLDPDALKDIMLRAQRKAYGDGLDHDALHPYMWVCKSHYYIDSLDFYNFPYAFGALFSLGLYRMYRERGAEFVPVYEQLLRNTGMMDTEDVAATVGVDITKPDFWNESLEQLADYARQYIKLVDVLTAK